MFCWITENWRVRPLVSREAVVELIANTTTGEGLSIEAELDDGRYPTGVKVSALSRRLSKPSRSQVLTQPLDGAPILVQKPCRPSAALAVRHQQQAEKPMVVLRLVRRRISSWVSETSFPSSPSR